MQQSQMELDEGIPKEPCVPSLGGLLGSGSGSGSTSRRAATAAYLDGGGWHQRGGGGHVALLTDPCRRAT